ncbi:MAG TPA: hypothetical protein VM165_05025 [Planctomycetaceae bacterium]|nr:hypothetical protein [Planctomycetaceae bacterium]
MSNTPDWMRDFADAVASHLQPVDVMSPLGCHLHRSVEAWEVTVFASSTEVVGGSRDGESRASRFHVDVLGVCQLFDELDGLSWQTHRLGQGDDLGPHIAIEGRVQGEPVWLRIPATAPKPFSPGRLAHANTQQWEEVW